MKYVALDLETTSLNHDPDYVLQISMVVEDSSRPEIPVHELPHYTRFINSELIQGQPYALAMNSWILDYLSGRKKNPPYPIVDRWHWPTEAIAFLRQHLPETPKMTVAGKNVAGFDLRFLPFEVLDCFRHRVIDVGPLFIDWTSDTLVPDLATCKRRAGVDTPVAHDAREDAMDVIRLLRTTYGKK